MIEKLVIMLTPMTTFIIVVFAIIFWDGFEDLNRPHKRVLKYIFYAGIFLSTLWAVAVNISLSTI